MSFRSEVRRFMEDMRQSFVEQRTIIMEQRRYINSLLKQNADLLNRLMARDYPELQTYSPVPYSKEEDTLNFEDEELAGTIIDGEENETR